MDFVTNEKLTIVGAAGMIGSNMAQTALMMRLTPNICLYDPYGPALEGVAEELYHCAFEGANITWTTDIREALTDAAYVVSSGGAARKAGMTREDLLKGNAQIAEQFGKDIKSYCPDVKHVVVVFNPADITGLITLIYAGLKPSQVSTLAALDSTRLRSELAKYFKISPDEIRNCRTYGGHGEQMAVFASTTLVAGRPLSELIGKEMPEGDWADLQQRVIQGGKHIDHYCGRAASVAAHRHQGAARAGMGRDEKACNRGRQAHHRPARPFVVPESGLYLDFDDRGGDGRQAVHLSRRRIRPQRRVQAHPHGDGDRHHEGGRVV